MMFSENPIPIAYLWQLPELLVSPDQDLELYDHVLYADARVLFNQNKIQAVSF